MPTWSIGVNVSRRDYDEVSEFAACDDAVSISALPPPPGDATDVVANVDIASQESSDSFVFGAASETTPDAEEQALDEEEEEQRKSGGSAFARTLLKRKGVYYIRSPDKVQKLLDPL